MDSETPIPVEMGDAFEKGKFFVIEPSFRGGGKIPGLEIANEDRLVFPRCADVTVFIIRPGGLSK